MAAVNQPITAILAGANECMVKLTDGQIVSVAKFQQLFDAAEEGEEPVIEGIVRGAGDSMVKLTDGRIIPLSQFLLELQEAEVGEEPEIEFVLSGAYNGQVRAEDDSVQNIGDLFTPSEGGGLAVLEESREGEGSLEPL